MQTLPELQIAGILIAPMIVAIIELLKRVGLPDTLAPWINAVLSVIAYGLVVVVSQHPDLANPVTYALNALAIFLTAAGVYDIGSNILAGSRAGA